MRAVRYARRRSGRAVSGRGFDSRRLHSGADPFVGVGAPLSRTSAMETDTAESSTHPPSTRAGLVALVGAPNAGKSTLLNRLVGQRLSIVTARPQTTRTRVIGIDTRDGVQMVLVDTPGLLDPRYLLHQAMLQAALEALDEADALVLLLDGTQPPPTLPAAATAALTRRRDRLVPAINKIDIATADTVDALERWALSLTPEPPVRISALQGVGIDELRQRIAALLPPSPFLYPEDELSSQPLRFFVAEWIRETAMELYRDEIPYSIAVEIEEFREHARPVYIRATMYVERESQKAIVIGAGGQALKRLGEQARRKLEAFLETPVYLDLWVKVLPKWRRQPSALRRLGFRLPEKPS